MEFSILIIGALACLFLAGPGEWSLDGRRQHSAARRAAGRARPPQSDRAGTTRKTMELASKVVLITGTRRIGGVVAAAVAKRGADVVLLYNRSKGRGRGGRGHGPGCRATGARASGGRGRCEGV
jgi:hypothetical protein